MSENQNNQNNTQEQELDINHLMQIRRDKLKELQEQGKEMCIRDRGERGRTAEEKNDVIKKAKVEMNYLTGEEAERRLQWLREKWERDYNSDMGQARREGRQQEKVEIVKKLLKTGMKVKEIAKIVDLKEEEIEKIQKDI